MAGWNGFTDEELRKLKTESESLETTEVKARASKVGQVKKKTIKEKRITSHEPEKNSIEPCNQSNRNILNNNAYEKKFSDVHESNEDSVLSEKGKESENLPDKKEINYNTVDQTFDELTADRVVEIEMSNLQKMQLQQKQIEDENKRKQYFIKQTLQEKFKQTQTEAVKLKEIQKQLLRLDECLQTDVEILRNKIDEACMLYSNAEKRYERAEKEYVDSKFDYFMKKEKKEQLTEHLYSIIQENELRKAKQLEELVQKLNTEVPKETAKKSTLENP